MNSKGISPHRSRNRVYGAFSINSTLFIFTARRCCSIQSWDFEPVFPGSRFQTPLIFKTISLVRNLTIGLVSHTPYNCAWYSSSRGRNARYSDRTISNRLHSPTITAYFRKSTTFVDADTFACLCNYRIFDSALYVQRRLIPLKRPYRFNLFLLW